MSKGSNIEDHKIKTEKHEKKKIRIVNLNTDVAIDYKSSILLSFYLTDKKECFGDIKTVDPRKD